MRTKLVTINVAKIRELMAEQNMSQTALAQLSGASRGYLVNLLKKDSVKVRWSTAEKLARALQRPVQELDKEGLKNEYLRAVAEQHKSLEFGGLGIVYTGPSIPFDRGFVPLTAKEDQPDENYPPTSHQLGKKASIGPKLPPFTIGKALQRSRQCCLLGDPGCGKTTVLRHIARAYALRRHEEHSYPAKPSIPIFIRVAAWGEQLRENEEVGVVEAVLSQMTLIDAKAAQRMAEWLNGQVQQQNVVLLLDGLDEVVEPEIQSLLLEKIRFFVNAHPDARVVVTSRIVGFEATNLGAYFTVFKIQPLPVETSSEFVKEWFAFKHGHSSEQPCGECESQTKQLMNRIAANPRIRAIASNPLMLTILALLNEAGGVLPQRRWDLYQKISEAFLFSWEESKRETLSGTIDHGLKMDNREVVWLLESVAYEMQRNDWTLVARWWLSRHFNSFLRDNLGYEPDEARNEAEALIWSLHQRAGLLVERGPERYGFSHLAFQEYFAASAILKESDPVKALKPYFYHPRWREVVCLAASRSDWHQLPRLLRSILDDPDPTGRFLQRGLLLALACLADGPIFHGDDILKQMKDEAIKLAKTKWIGISLDVLRRLNALKFTRFKNLAVDTTERMLTIAEGILEAGDYSFLQVWNTITQGPSHLFSAFEQASTLEGTVPVKGKGSKEPGVEETLPPIIEIPLLPSNESVHFTIAKIPKAFDKQWCERVLRQLTSDKSAGIREMCARELGKFVKKSQMVKKGLMETLGCENDSDVREVIAQVLAPVADQREVRELLKEFLAKDTDEGVRGACASALEKSAVKHKSTKDRLISILRSDESPVVRAGCAHGLSRIAAEDEGVRNFLLDTMRKEEEDDTVRVACIWSLEQIIPSLNEAIDFLKDNIHNSPDTNFSHRAAQILGKYASTGKIKLDQLPIEKIERVLVSIRKPCQHVLDVLRGLVDAREIHKKGIPREDRIRRALSQFTDRIKVMFVFGSSAKDTQDPESDIDLLIIGDVSLKELIPGLRQAEQELGKEVNAIIYSQDEWRNCLRDGNPFVKNVLREEKILIIGGTNELAGMAG